MALKRKRGDAKPLEEMSARELQRVIAQARKTIESLPDRPPREQQASLIAGADVALGTLVAAQAQLARQDAERRDAERRTRFPMGKSLPATPVARALASAGRWLGGDLELVASRLTDAEGQELIELVKRWKQLTDSERARAETLVGTAAGDPHVFVSRREGAKLRIAWPRSARSSATHAQP